MNQDFVFGLFGVLVAYIAGIVTACQFGVMKNSAQIRKNSETIRRQAEARLR